MSVFGSTLVPNTYICTHFKQTTIRHSNPVKYITTIKMSSTNGQTESKTPDVTKNSQNDTDPSVDSFLSNDPAKGTTIEGLDGTNPNIEDSTKSEAHRLASNANPTNPKACSISQPEGAINVDDKKGESKESKIGQTDGADEHDEVKDLEDATADGDDDSQANAPSQADGTADKKAKSSKIKDKSSTKKSIKDKSSKKESTKDKDASKIAQTGGADDDNEVQGQADATADADNHSQADVPSQADGTAGQDGESKNNNSVKDKRSERESTKDDASKNVFSKDSSKIAQTDGADDDDSSSLQKTVQNKGVLGAVTDGLTSTLGAVTDSLGSGVTGLGDALTGSSNDNKDVKSDDAEKKDDDKFDSDKKSDSQTDGAANATIHAANIYHDTNLIREAFTKPSAEPVPTDLALKSTPAAAESSKIRQTDGADDASNEVETEGAAKLVSVNVAEAIGKLEDAADTDAKNVGAIAAGAKDTKDEAKEYDAGKKDAEKGQDDGAADTKIDANTANVLGDAAGKGNTQPLHTSLDTKPSQNKLESLDGAAEGL
jgi:hypothetical protein